MDPLEFILTIGCFVLASITGVLLLQQGIRGRLALASACCRKCRYPLGLHNASTDACSECGNPLDQRNAVRLARKKRSPIIIGLAILLLISAFLVPPAFALMMRTTPGTMAVAPTATTPTWLLPPSQTPGKNNHFSSEIQVIPTSELLDAGTIRPNDGGIWDEIVKRRKQRLLNDLEEERLIDQLIALYERTDHIDFHDTTRETTRWDNYFWGLSETASVIDSMLKRMDPDSQEDNARIERLIMAAGRPENPVLFHANERGSLNLRYLLEVLDALKSETSIRSLSCTLDDEVLYEKNQSRSIRSKIWLDQPVPEERLGDDLVLKMDIDMEILEGRQGEERTWRLQPVAEIPIMLLAPGDSPVTYHEPQVLPQHYIDAFQKTQVRAWTPQSNTNKRMLTVELESPLGESSVGMIFMEVDLPIDAPPVKLSPRSTREIGYAFTSSSISSWSSSEKVFEVDGNFEQDTVNVILEPSTSVDLDRHDERGRNEGRLGVRVHIEDIPVRWIDRAAVEPIRTKPNIRIERIGSVEEGASSPYMGPVPVTTPEMTEASEAMRTWLQPTFQQTGSSARPGTLVMQYGSDTPLPMNAYLRMRIEDSDGRLHYRNLTLTPETTTGETGSPEAKTVGITSGLQLTPGETVHVEFRGFPVSMRRDKRELATPWFGGSFTIDVPVTGTSSSTSSRRSSTTNSTGEE